MNPSLLSANCHDSACQFFMPGAKRLVGMNAGAGQATVKFRVETPDSRLRTKIAVLYIPEAGGDPITGIVGTANLWLAEVEDDQSGVSGTDVPCTNVEGTSAAPTAIPAANGLYGYSREFVTAADGIVGAFTANGILTSRGSWVLQVRYQPQSVRFEWDEWEELRSRMGITLITPAQRLGT